MAATGLDRDFPLPTDFPETAGPDELNLVVLGESSAVGFPCHEWLSVGRILDWQLSRAFPERRVRVEILAHEGDTLELQHQRLSQLRRRPDAVIVYCGHNEFAARYPPLRSVDHYRDQRSAPSDRAIGRGLSRLSPFARLLDRIAERQRVGIRPASNDRRSLVDVPVYSEAERAERLADFRGRLERIVEFCREVGALPVLLIPPGNDADFEPNRSFLSPHTEPQDREEFARRFRAIRLVEEADPSQAVRGYRESLSEQPGFAEAHFRLARLLRKEGRSDEAYEHFRAARDLDGLPIRCLTELQDAYRDVARRHEAVLVDGQELFHSLGKQGQLDDVLFHDAMHPSVRGHVALAEAVLRALQARRAFGWAADAPPVALDPAAVAGHFGIDNPVWELLCGRAAMFYFGFLGARYDTAERLAKQELYQEAARRIAKGEAPASLGLPNIGFASDNRSTSRRP